MTSMLEKSDESYVFSRSDCISHFSPPVLFDISLCIDFFIYFRLFLTPFSLVFRIKRGMKMNGNFHIDFLKKCDFLLTPFSSIWESLWLPLGTFGRKMDARERVRFVPKWGPAPKEPRTPLQTPFWRYSGSILRRFWTLWDIPWDAFGRPFWQVA